jgi:hypothetical protein
MNYIKEKRWYLRAEKWTQLTSRQQFLSSVLKVLEVRFPDGNQTSNPIVKAF